MNKFKLLFCVIALTLFASACQTTQIVGDGDVKMARSIANHFTKFVKDHGASHFYLSTDGAYATYLYCSDHGCRPSNQGKVIRNCSKGAAPAECRLFANKSEIIWKNHGNFMPYKSEVIAEAYGDYFTD